jgi:hypothetical protein
MKIKLYRNCHYKFSLAILTKDAFRGTSLYIDYPEKHWFRFAQYNMSGYGRDIYLTIFKLSFNLLWR